jgi:hypothetical protein
MSRDVKPLHSKRQVDIAGMNFRNGNYSQNDLEIIYNWRASHNHILNSWQATLSVRPETC